MVLVACQDEGKTLETENLEKVKVIQTANNKEGQQYKAASLDIAIDAIPFELNVPNDFPKTFHPVEPTAIIDWIDTEDGENISVKLIASSNDRIRKTLTIYARDFEINDFNKEAEKITLVNDKDVYFIPDRLSNAGHSVSVEWTTDEVFYSLNFSGKTDHPDEANQMLLELAQKMQ